jgi:hypothetical protein
MDVDIEFLVEILLDAELAGTLRTTDSAAWIDSCMTSPSLPVVIILPLPGTRYRLDGEQFAADLGPRQAGDLPDLVLLLGMP